MSLDPADGDFSQSVGIQPKGCLRMTEYDHHEIYCRSLGDCINFSYCRAAGGPEPCARILDCWIGRLPIVEFLKKSYNSDTLERILTPPPGRLQRIMSIAERVSRNIVPPAKS
jgi:hypothetical protein